jgi:ectoine hydroxylase-related dioxygenase (phytanoyl-CoA dioxygenase family)
MNKLSRARELRLADILEGEFDASHNDSVSALALMNEIRFLGLAEYVAEMDILGYTVIPPEKVAGASFAKSLLDKMLDVAERRHGTRPVEAEFGNRTSEALAKGPFKGFGHPLRYLLLEDPIFQEAALNPVVTAMSTYLVGGKAHIFGCFGYLKGQGNDDLDLHTDMGKIPAPFSQPNSVCTLTWALSDYSIENGSISFVPGSHRRQRHPNYSFEGGEDRVGVDAPMGSLIIHNGSTWHGAFARQTPGWRASLALGFSRSYITPHEDYRKAVTPEILARHPRRFAIMTDQENNMPWNQAGPEPLTTFDDEATRFLRFGRSTYD